MGRVETAHATSEGPWRCKRCGHEGILRVFAEGTVVNGRAVRAGVPLTGAVQPPGEREAERNARVARSLAVCPDCRRRPIGPHRRLVAQVLAVGAIVGSGGAVAAGSMTALALAHDPGPDLPRLESLVLQTMVGSFALGTLTTASVIYLRRLANVARWGKFVGQRP